MSRKRLTGREVSASLVLGTTAVLIASLLSPSASAIAPSGHSTYKLAFREAGLPKNTSWSVDLSGSIHSSNGTWVIYPQISNGTYSYAISTNDTRYAPHPGNGNVTIAGFAVYPEINFTVETYTVTFKESGLPTGTSWTVSLNGTEVSSNNSTLVIDKHNGTFPFAVNSYHNIYAPRPGDGFVTVNGGAPPEYIAFNAFTYPVRFEREDAVSVAVALYVAGATYNVPANGSVTVDLTNGTYTYNASVGVFGTSVPPGSFTVAGAAVTIPLVVYCGTSAGCLTVPTMPSSTQDSGGLPGGELAVAVVAVLAIALLALGAVLAWRSWRRAEERANRDPTPPRGFG
jgi:hypothetical protein